MQASRQNGENDVLAFGQEGIQYEDLYLMQLNRCGGTAEVILAVPTLFHVPLMLTLGEAYSM